MTTDPAAVEKVLSWTNYDDVRSIIAAYKKKFKDIIKPVEIYRPDPGHVAIFYSKEHLNIWLFCMYQHITLTHFEGIYNQLYDRPLDKRCLEEPHSIFTGKNRKETIDMFKTVNADFFDDGKLDNKKNIRAYCRLCHGTEFAYIIRGPLLLHDIPGNLRAARCWCRR
jgi:hypothetical protein